MSDEQGTTAVDDPGKYTVSFGADQRAAFRIDCNRGNSSTFRPTPNGRLGHLTFGPMALTSDGSLAAVAGTAGQSNGPGAGAGF